MKKNVKISARSGINASLIAPCGMNCGTCLAFLRDINRCSGCRNKVNPDRKSAVNCSIVNCKFLAETESKFCYDCVKYPCRRLKQLDKRYRTKYKTSFFENLEFIRDRGVEAFSEREKIKWHCAGCGGTICIHRGYCLHCKSHESIKN